MMHKVVYISISLPKLERYGNEIVSKSDTRVTIEIRSIEQEPPCSKASKISTKANFHFWNSQSSSLFLPLLRPSPSDCPLVFWLQALMTLPADSTECSPLGGPRIFAEKNTKIW